MALSPVSRQLDRLEERTRDIATRSDLEALRKEVVARDSLEPQLNALKAQISRVDLDRLDDRKSLESRLDAMKDDQISRADRLWIRLGQIAAFVAILLSLFEFLSRLKITP